MGLYLTTVTADPSRPAAAAKTSVALSTTSVLLVPSNPDRRFVSIYNLSNRTLYLSFGATASLTDFTVQVPKDVYFEGQKDGYTGDISGIWQSSGTGAAKITEVS